jgi:hypothetical protein
MTGAQALQCMILSEVLEVSKNPWDHFPLLLPPVLNRACPHYGAGLISIFCLTAKFTREKK